MKRSYFDTLTRAARWHLPPDEAQEVLEDYAALLAEPPRSEEALREEVGDPVAAVRALVEPNHYRRWLLVFGVLTAWIMLPALSILWGPGGLPLFSVLDDFLQGLSRLLPFPVMPLLGLTVGVLLALLWFRRQGAKMGPRPRGLLPLLLLPLAGMALVWWVAGRLMLDTIRQESWYIFSSIPPDIVGLLVSGMLGWSGLAIALLGLWALVQARVADRRWAALFILCLAEVALAMAVLSLLHSLNLDGISTGWWNPFIGEYLTITLLGLIGTGVALC